MSQITLPPTFGSARLSTRPSGASRGRKLFGGLFGGSGDGTDSLRELLDNLHAFKDYAHQLLGTLDGAIGERDSSGVLNAIDEYVAENEQSIATQIDQIQRGVAPWEEPSASDLSELED